MRKKLIMGNWKMNGRLEGVKLLLNNLTNLLSELPSNIQCVVLPPAIYVPLAQSYLNNTPITWGGQNIYSCEKGAFTGEHSLLMFKDYGCRYILLGHSERRKIFAENENFIAEKFHLVKEHDMIPVLCIGETLEERLVGKTEAVLHKQLQALSQENKRCFQNAVIAYEPVWAIGTGQTATVEQVQAAHYFIRQQVAALNLDDAKNVSILYGGSVNEKNAVPLLSLPDVDGGLIGGASLNAQQFAEIVQCIN